MKQFFKMCSTSTSYNIKMLLKKYIDNGNKEDSTVRKPALVL